MLEKVKIEWTDSKEGEGWESLDEIQDKPALCRTCGWVVNESEESVTIAHTISKNQCCGRITIPKASIKTRKNDG